MHTQLTYVIHTVSKNRYNSQSRTGRDRQEKRNLLGHYQTTDKFVQ